MQKKDLMWPYEKYPTHDYNFWFLNEGYLHQKHIQNS